MGTPPMLYRCSCGNLLRKRDIAIGICAGHRVSPASNGSFFEWLKVRYWRIRGLL